MPFDGSENWLMPLDDLDALDAEFAFDYDPCPFPRPEGYDGLAAEWGLSNFVNPPFKGPTAWVRKSIAEHAKGKRVVFVFPVDKWVLMLLAAGAQVRNLGDVKWASNETGLPSKGTGRHIAAFILDADVHPTTRMPRAVPRNGWPARLITDTALAGAPDEPALDEGAR